MRSKSDRYPNILVQSGKIKDQVYLSLKDAILSGKLTKGEKIPSSRALSEMLSISRNSVLSGLYQLIDEGYLVTKVGSGTYVTDIIPDEYVIAQKHSIGPLSPPERPLDINPSAENLVKIWNKSNPLYTNGKVFHVGAGCTDIFPKDIWIKLVNKAWRMSLKKTIPNDPKGDPLLRKTICDYVCTVRGANCTPEQIVIVNGTQQALNLISHIVLQKNDGVWLDEPGYDGALATFKAAGANIYPIPCDQNGMDINFGKTNYPNAKLIFTAPSHQFPIGSVLSLARRMELLEWAKKNKIWIIEDDYNSEFRYSSRPIQSLQGLDKYDRVIYAGSFSKMIFPELRVGFVILPRSLVDIFTINKFYADSCNYHIEQTALALFIRDGYYAKHVRRVRKTCFDRKKALIKAINQYLPQYLAVQPSDSGIHIVCWLLNGLTEESIISKAKTLDLGMQPLSRYYQNPSNQPGVLLGFADHKETILIDAIKRLARIL